MKKIISVLFLLGIITPVCLAQSINMESNRFELSSGQGEGELSPGYLGIDEGGDVHLSPAKLVGVENYTPRILLAENYNDLVVVGPGERFIPANSGIGLSVETYAIFWQPILVRDIYLLPPDVDAVAKGTSSSSLQKEVASSDAAVELPDGRDAVALYRLVLWLVEEDRKNKEEIALLKQQGVQFGDTVTVSPNCEGYLGVGQPVYAPPGTKLTVGGDARIRGKITMGNISFFPNDTDPVVICEGGSTPPNDTDYISAFADSGAKISSSDGEEGLDVMKVILSLQKRIEDLEAKK